MAPDSLPVLHRSVLADGIRGLTHSKCERESLLYQSESRWTDCFPGVNSPVGLLTSVPQLTRRTLDNIVRGWRPKDHREILTKLAPSAPRFSTVGDVRGRSYSRAEKVKLPTRVHNEYMATNEHGWIGHGAGDNSHLTDEQRQVVEGRIRERQEQRGGLLGVVEVYVYEHGCQEQVIFPHGSLLGVETDASVISEIVARASAELANWR